ncbi:hypothetical protein [Kribbella sp. C-35]|uniref:hypothetical protein n=1 Tax=Kribbella sp. C-35 TaxID=2789276 RepID=UPI00397C308C
MSIGLTSYPFDDPEGKELLEGLATIYWQKKPIVTFLRAAALKPQTVNLDEDALGIWHQTLDQAARSAKLVVLLDEVAADSQSLVLRPLIERLRLRASAPDATDFDIFELAMLSPTRSFIGRPDLRRHLKEFGKAYGARVLVVREEQESNHVGRTHSWYLINEIGQRLRVYDSYRFDLTDWSGPPQGPRDVMAEICGQLGWELPTLDMTAQPSTVVRLLVTQFKRLGRTLTRRTCLVFDAYTVDTADDWARALVVSIAAAANAGEAGDVCVALLEVDARLPPELARDAMPEDLRGACLTDLEKFFAAAAAAEGLNVPSEHMPLLLEKVLGAPPYSDELVLPTVGPRAAEIAASVFGGRG